MVAHETTTKDFERDVLQASMTTPVIVDFWAPWCGPCRQLMPVLEKGVAAVQGRVKMVTVNIDVHPELAQAFRVQSVPMVYAFFQGQPVDGFMGARPESEINTFVQKLAAMAANADDASPRVLDEQTKKQIERLSDRARQFFSDENMADAMSDYSAILDLDPQNTAALAGIAWCLLIGGDGAAARDVLTDASPEQASDAAFKGLQKIFSLADQASDLPSIETLQERLAKNPKDHAARHDLSIVLFGQGKLVDAIDELVTITRYDREWNNQAARQLLTDVLESFGPAHPLTAKGRRKLSAVLFS